jgi:hypothetical protein
LHARFAHLLPSCNLSTRTVSAGKALLAPSSASCRLAGSAAVARPDPSQLPKCGAKPGIAQLCAQKRRHTHREKGGSVALSGGGTALAHTCTAMGASAYPGVSWAARAVPRLQVREPQCPASKHWNVDLKCMKH